MRALRGTVTFDGRRIDRVPTHRIARLGIAQSPEGRRIFAPMTVLENLELGAFARTDREAISQDLERVLALFPRLRDRLAQKGARSPGASSRCWPWGALSWPSPTCCSSTSRRWGSRPSSSRPSSTSSGTSTSLGTTILLVEQNARMALRVAHRGYVIQTGRIVLQDAASALLRSDVVRKAYLGEK